MSRNRPVVIGVVIFAAMLFSAFSLSSGMQNTEDRMSDSTRRTSGGVFSKEIERNLINKAERGDGEACYCLSVHYADNDAEIHKWLRKGVEMGNADSEYALSEELQADFPGQAMKQAEALELLKKAAVKGHPFAQTALGSRYREGKIVARDVKQAEHWYEKAAMQGITVAMQALSKMLKETRSDEAGLVEAYAWSAIALSMLHSNSVAARNTRSNQKEIAEKGGRLRYDKTALVRDGELLAVKKAKQVKVSIKNEGVIEYCRKLGST